MTDRVPFTITYNPALRNTQDILRKKKPILHSTESLRNIFKEVLLSCRIFNVTFVTFKVTKVTFEDPARKKFR